jgi:hypothetical protein
VSTSATDKEPLSATSPGNPESEANAADPKAKAAPSAEDKKEAASRQPKPSESTPTGKPAASEADQKERPDNTPSGATNTAAGGDEILPPANEDETLRSKIVLLLRTLGKPRPESSPSALVPKSSGPLVGASAAAPPLPPRRGFFRRHLLFFLSVVVPTLIAALYFGFLASDVFVSESRFVVRTPNKQTTGGLSGILQGAGFSGIGRAPEDVHTVGQYALSRDALSLLDGRLQLRTAWGDAKIDVMRRGELLDGVGLARSPQDGPDHLAGEHAVVVNLESVGQNVGDP